MGHPGRNNSFQVRSKSDLSVIYNDVSVLENMHAARATRLLSLAGDEDDGGGNSAGSETGDLDILARMQPTQKDAFRSLFRRAILNTDMTLHFAQVAQMKARVSSGIGRGSHPLDDDDDDLVDGRYLEKFYQTMDGRSINMALLFFLHAADVSNPAKAGPLFTEWCERSLRELFEQGDEERRRYLLPLSPMCDRDNINKNDSQIGYIKFIVRPTFVLLSDMIPNVVTEILPVLERNLRYWENRKKVELGLPVDEEEEEAEEQETDVEEVVEAEKVGPNIVVDDATLSGDESLLMEEHVLKKPKEKSRTEETRKPKGDYDRNNNNNNNNDINNTGSSKSYERKRSKDNTSKSHDKKRSTNANTHANTKSSVERKSSKEYDSKKVERKKSKEGTGSKPLERKKSRDENAMTGSSSGGGVKASRRGSGKQMKKDTIKSKEEMMANILSKPTFDRDGSVYFS
mmetsp:Transcript_13848/g.28505  ORF Transcript_13848/g.28505 Transcript_13848/m.28505 type:complete len:458 (+) Transcript_13848:1-1374(+)